MYGKNKILSDFSYLNKVYAVNHKNRHFRMVNNDERIIIAYNIKIKGLKININFY